MNNNFITNIIWEELSQAKFRVEYINQFSDKYIKRNRRIKVFYLVVTVILSFAGILTDYKNITLYAMLASSIILTFGEDLMFGPDKISKVNKVFNFYHSHYVEIQSLYNLYAVGHISDKECIEKYKYLKLNETNINEIILEIFIKQDKKLKNIGIQLTSNYLNKVYGTETHE
jgi:hypothetical protein